MLRRVIAALFEDLESAGRYRLSFSCRRCMGEYPPATPREIRLISVTFGDSLEAVHSIAGRKGGGDEKG
jgi:hypothetical protein